MVKFNESESESEGASHASEPRFRVRVCMQRFYRSGDVRARAYVCVSPRRRVRWLQRRLRRLFALPRLRLLSRGHLLPPQEPLALLQPDDPVEVVPADAEPDDVTTPRDVVDCVDDVPVTTVEESQRSPSPVYPDDLTETKRQALMMLEQFCASPATESAPKPRRRRVRRRRRLVRTGVGTGTGTDADDEPPPAPLCRDPVAVAMVLRNELQPRAPRVVRPLPDRNKGIILHDTSPTEIVFV